MKPSLAHSSLISGLLNYPLYLALYFIATIDLYWQIFALTLSVFLSLTLVPLGLLGN